MGTPPLQNERRVPISKQEMEDMLVNAYRRGGTDWFESFQEVMQVMIDRGTDEKVSFGQVIQLLGTAQHSFLKVTKMMGCK